MKLTTHGLFRSSLAFALAASTLISHAQDDLLQVLGPDTPTVQYTSASFKSTRVINGQSLENLPQGVLDFRISHRFGYLNSGINEFYGLDQASFRLGFDYGLTDRLMIGIGRSTYQKTVDGLIKYKLLRQCDQGCGMPVTMNIVAATSVTTLTQEQVPWFADSAADDFSNRLAYSFQVVVGRKFSEGLTVELTPGVVHRNLVATPEAQNDLYNLGLAGRVKVSKRIALTGEYFYVLPDQGYREPFHNSLALGVDIQTGGHVFQLQVTNSTGMFERAYITETTGDFFNGDIHFGFNISRVFTIYDPKAKARKKEQENAK